MNKQIIDLYNQARKRLFLFDYDGSLVPIGAQFVHCPPPPTVVTILRQLSQSPDTQVTIISGRDRYTLASWFSDDRIDLCAEFATWIRQRGIWKQVVQPEKAWKPTVQAFLTPYCASVPGSFVEEKECALVWDFRYASVDLSERVATKLLLDIANTRDLSSIELASLRCEKSVLITTPGNSKGTGVQYWLQEGNYDFIWAGGDDAPDEEMFAALPAEALSIRIGNGSTIARYQLPDQHTYITLLATLAAVAQPSIPEKLPVNL